LAERSSQIAGIQKTINFLKNRVDFSGQSGVLLQRSPEWVEFRPEARLPFRFRFGTRQGSRVEIIMYKLVRRRI